MKALIKWLGILLVLVSITGCIESKILVRVNPDGSGELVETFLMSKEMLQMIAGVSSLGQEQEQAEPELLDIDKLKEKSSLMGEGVTLVSADRVSTDKSQGYTAVYKFGDINKIMVNQNPDENVPQPPAEDDGEHLKEFMTFKFTKGTETKPSVLMIISPREEQQEEPGGPGPTTNSQTHAGSSQGDEPSGPSEQEEMMMGIFKETFRDMKIEVAVEINGDIVKTDAEYVDGRRIVLMELDFSRIVENEEALRTLAMSENGSLASTKAVMAKVPGIRIELKDKVEVQFK
jgi:hypothetical protein